MTLHDYYLRAAVAKRDLERANARVDRIGQIFWNGRIGALKRWGSAARRAAAAGRERLFVFEVARGEARDRMFFDPYEEAANREIARRFREVRKRIMS